MKLINETQCLGCSACSNVCPNGSASIKLNDKGFYEAVINDETCLKCNLCYNACSIVSSGNSSGSDSLLANKFFSAKNKNLYEQKSSASGGVSSGLAKIVIGKGGVVYGAAYSDLKVKTIRIDKMNDIEEIKGSKYVQSFLGDIFMKVKSDLERGVLVLFTGLPCQLFGLKVFLKKDYSNLITCQLICHGVSSVKFYNNYINYLETKYKEKVEAINFRGKEIEGWSNANIKIKFVNKEKQLLKLLGQTSFGIAYSKCLNISENCFKCKYLYSTEADFTLGDYWGCSSEVIDENGLSLIIVNGDKAEKLLYKQNVIEYKLLNEHEKNLAITGNPRLVKGRNIPSNYFEFQKDMEKLDFKKLIKKYKLHLSKLLIIKIKLQPLNVLYKKIKHFNK
ncbi:MAG: Coenzyme F420 hydrogenase/dehydrogenase, beta subunit C-terminal domain [Erysipelotrichaceae bacterium]